MLELERAKELLDKFGLNTASILLDAKLESAAKREDTYLSFLLELLEDENSQRKARSQEARLKLSNLPHHKTLADFDFSFQPGIDQRQIKELSTLSFVARKENVIFLGPPGSREKPSIRGLGYGGNQVRPNSILCQRRRPSSGPEESGSCRQAGKPVEDLLASQSADPG